MKKHNDLIRELLIHLESVDEHHLFSWEIELPGWSQQQITYHLSLMLDAGLIDGERGEDSMSRWVHIFGMTDEGHETLAEIAEKTRWHKLRDYLAQEGLSLTRETVKILTQKILE